jgi:hypothetical protein
MPWFVPPSVGEAASSGAFGGDRGTIGSMTPPSLPFAAMPAGGPSNRPLPVAEPTHACIRCGRPGVPADAGLCEECNPLELAQPSATQVHGIAALGIVVFVVVLAVAAHALLVGTGPFTGSVLAATPAAGGLDVTLVVHNAGSKAGATTCELVPASRPAGNLGELVQTPSIPAGSNRTFTVTVTKLGTTPIELAADCQSP